MGIDLSKFLKDEGLNIEGFDRWIEKREGLKNREEDMAKKRIIAKDKTLMRKLLEGIKGEKETNLIMEELEAEGLLVENSSEFLVNVRYSKGTFRLPRGLVDLREKPNDN